MKVLYSSLVAAATIVGAAPAFAQTPAAAPAPPACDIDQSRPQAIARATLSITKAQALMNGGDPTKDLKDVVAILNTPNFKNENPIGRAYLLGSAYVFLAEQPGIQAIGPRGAIGLTTDPTGTIDLFLAADSAISVVENVSAACKEYMKPFRQQKAWINVTNAAINALNAQKLDSAEYYAKRSLILDKSSPYPYTVLASVAKQHKNTPALLEYSKQVVTIAGDDTAYADVKQRAQYELAVVLADQAKAASGAERKSLAQQAIAAWTPISLSSDIVEGTVAVRNLQELYVLAGDSASLQRIYAPMLANPTKYSEGALLQAGVIASQIKKPEDAVKLFEAVAANNPYSRDAMNNVAASLLQAGKNDEAMPYIDKLIALDPSNPENYNLYAFAYIGKLKTKTDAKTTKTNNDSLVYWSNKAEKMPVKVVFNEFSRNPDGTTLAGTIENRGTAAKTYTLSIEFLDSKGQTVATETAEVGPIAPKQSKEFTIKSAKGGVAGYRYKPLT